MCNAFSEDVCRWDLKFFAVFVVDALALGDGYAKICVIVENHCVRTAAAVDANVLRIAKSLRIVVGFANPGKKCNISTRPA